MINSLFIWLALVELPVPLLPPKHLNGSDFLKWIVYLMDEYRDLRLVWTVVEGFLLIFILGLIIYFIWKVQQVNKNIKEKYAKLDSKIQRIQNIHGRIDELEGK